MGNLRISDSIVQGGLLVTGEGGGGVASKYAGYTEGTVTYVDRRTGRYTPNVDVGNLIHYPGLAFIFIANNENANAQSSRAAVNFEDDVVGKWFALGPPPATPPGIIPTLRFYVDDREAVRPHIGKSFVIENIIGEPVNFSFASRGTRVTGNVVSEGNYVPIGVGSTTIPDGEARLVTLESISDESYQSYNGTINFRMSAAPAAETRTTGTSGILAQRRVL